MILYVDTSALVKLYISEEFSDEVRVAIQRGSVVATSWLSFAETRAAVAAIHRDKRITQAELDALIVSFDADWERFVRVEPTHDVIRAAAILAGTHALRGYDAVQLASALTLPLLTGERVVFLGFDGRLMSAALAEGLRAA